MVNSQTSKMNQEPSGSSKRGVEITRGGLSEARQQDAGEDQDTAEANVRHSHN
ncbi:hypothetical protein NE236_09040 [Actinoallomurus purpureus]|uniref:hypothetical protein n=1 Tax=Actinoallomurus purpureus TaxID=478114 RepID=UPI002093489C|nr:hypothetical protein [Actinoallomurus purpureus]MCO6005128.1 hypothetical protein [Actinoallomurus purpureus]